MPELELDPGPDFGKPESVTTSRARIRIRIVLDRNSNPGEAANLKDQAPRYYSLPVTMGHKKSPGRLIPGPLSARAARRRPGADDVVVVHCRHVKHGQLMGKTREKSTTNEVTGKANGGGQKVDIGTAV